jgi:hypothetical protein
MENKERQIAVPTISNNNKKVRGEPFEWGPYRVLQNGENVNPEHIHVGEDGVSRVPCRIYSTNGHKPTTSPKTR